MEHNVNALLLLYVHRDIKLDYQKIYKHVCYALPKNGSKNPINWTVTDEKFNFVLRDFEVFKILAIRSVFYKCGKPWELHMNLCKNIALYIT